MVTLEEAAKIAEANLSPNLRLCGEYGEAQGRYVFGACPRSTGTLIPCGANWTVDKETGKYEFTRLKYESLKPNAKMIGYKKLGEFD